MKRKLVLCAACVLMLSLVCIPTYAHPGRTDSNGGHTDHSTGEYHYHHGYPAHDHYDMDGDGILDCPYDFVDKTKQTNGNSSRNNTNAEKSYEIEVVSLSTIPVTAQPAPEEDVKEVPIWVHGIICVLAFSVIYLSASNKRKTDELKQAKKIQDQNEANHRKEISGKEQELKNTNTLLDLSQENGHLLCKRIKELESHVSDLTEKTGELEDMCMQNALLREESTSLSQQIEILKKENQELMAATSAKGTEGSGQCYATPPDWEIHNLEVKVDALNLELSNKNSQIASITHELQESREQLDQVMHKDNRLKKIPQGISYARDGLPIYWKPNPKKPYGDYTVYWNEKSEIYHTDYFCSSYASKETHIFKIVDIARPCKKCAEGFFDFKTVPDWYIPPT